MQRDNPDTIAVEDSPWQHTELDDVFVPSVRVQLGWADVVAAVERGAVVQRQAHALWADWASPLSGLRVGAHGLAQDAMSAKAQPADEPMPAIHHSGAVVRNGLWLGLGLVLGVVLGAGGLGCCWVTEPRLPLIGFFKCPIKKAAPWERLFAVGGAVRRCFNTSG